MNSKLKTLAIAFALAAGTASTGLAQTAPGSAPPKPAASTAKPATAAAQPATKPATKPATNTAAKKNEVNTVPRLSSRCPTGMVLYLGECFPSEGYGGTGSRNSNYRSSYGR